MTSSTSDGVVGWSVFLEGTVEDEASRGLSWLRKHMMESQLSLRPVRGTHHCCISILLGELDTTDFRVVEGCTNSWLTSPLDIVDRLGRFGVHSQHVSVVLDTSSTWCKFDVSRAFLDRVLVSRQLGFRLEGFLEPGTSYLLTGEQTPCVSAVVRSNGTVARQVDGDRPQEVLEQLLRSTASMAGSGKPAELEIELLVNSAVGQVGLDLDAQMVHLLSAHRFRIELTTRK